MPGAVTGNAWASEYDAQQEAQDHEDVWRQFNGVRPVQLLHSVLESHASVQTLCICTAASKPCC